jgi:hypothetical protein
MTQALPQGTVVQSPSRAELFDREERLNISQMMSRTHVVPFEDTEECCFTRRKGRTGST